MIPLSSAEARAMQVASAAVRVRDKTPPDVVELIAEGGREEAHLKARARDAAALRRVQDRSLRRMATIEHTVSAEVRARLMARLVDYLTREDIAELIHRVLSAPRFVRTRRRKVRGPARKKLITVPEWIPVELVGAYRDDARDFGEVEAAARARRRKRELIPELAEISE